MGGATKGGVEAAKRMDQMLFEAITKNDRSTFTSLVRFNEGILKQRDASLNSALHLATRYGCTELVEEIVKLCPELVAAENDEQETPLHEACRQGNADVSSLLLDTNPFAATKLNHENQSAFSLACMQGHLNVVKLMLNHSRLMKFEEENALSTPVHVAITRGHMDIVKEILEVRPNFAGKADKNGLSPLHWASSRGNLEITKLLLSLDLDLALQYNNAGYTPLHLAAINGNVRIIEAFILSSPTSFNCLTAEEETVFHLAVRFDKVDAFFCLAKSLNFTKLIRRQDQFGNTVLHLAVLRKNDRLVEYIINEKVLDINCQNSRGQTAFDILDQSVNARNLKKKLIHAGAVISIRLSSPNPEVNEIDSEPTILHRCWKRIRIEQEKKENCNAKL